MSAVSDGCPPPPVPVLPPLPELLPPFPELVFPPLPEFELPPAPLVLPELMTPEQLATPASSNPARLVRMECLISFTLLPAAQRVVRRSA
jgi:hypothetical protein